MNTALGSETPRLLVVDDEENVLTTLAAILEQEGYEVVAAGNAADALTHIRNERFDLLLTDLRIEGSSGLELLTALRERSPETPSVMLTGYASLESAIDAIREGAYDYLIKPCHVDELKATVARAIERGVLGRALRERLGELNEANSKLRTLSEGLQERVDQATAKLRHSVDELAETNRQLEEATQIREEFISMAAHELKTPITSLRGSAQLMLRRLGRDDAVDADSMRRGLHVIEQQSGKLARLITQMLDLTRVRAGRLELNPERTELVRLLRDVAANEQTFADEHRIVVDTPDELYAVVDPLRIDQVLTNLIDNAIKYSPAGGEIRAVLRRIGDQIELSVTDEGAGIPAEARDRIFERFYRGSADTNKSGMGLGLYITRQIVESHGGEIRADSPPKGGTRFVVTLPSNDAPATAASASASASST
ncbi:MAG: hypothetical protein QOF51_2505 [Chloroflexota bacterium]|jgi:signal transduction histidine kinase|nr:hypothetical protein [Chloroflexota bacterium]